MSVSTSPAEISEPSWVSAVLHFWFLELTEAKWFAKDAELDERIRKEFLKIHEQLSENAAEEVSGARATLAAVVVLDQFSRNMFRRDARAFASDVIARRLASAAIEQGLDEIMSREERLFLYMPFEHSEDRRDQARSLELMKSLDNESWTNSARIHKEIIDRFGRFPHRNAVLGRQSTAEEMEALNDWAEAF